MDSAWWFGALGISVVSETRVKPQGTRDFTALPFPRWQQQHLEVRNFFCGVLTTQTHGCGVIFTNTPPFLYINLHLHAPQLVLYTPEVQVRN